MNKKLVAAALGLAFAAPVFADSSNVTLYGRVHQALDHQSNDNGAGVDRGGNFALEDVSSRLGVRGEEDLGGGLKAVFAYELSFNSDASDNNSGLDDARHSYLGLSGAWGTFVAGTQDGGNLSQAPLYNQASLIGSVSNNGGPLTTVGSSVVGTAQAITRDQRVNNSFGYQTTIAGVAINARHSMGDSGVNNAANNNGLANKENSTRNTEVAATYKIGALTVGGGFQSVDSQDRVQQVLDATAGVEQVIQGVASYNFGSFTLGGLIAQKNLYSANAANGEDSNTEYALSGTLPLAGNSGIFGMYADSERNDLLAPEDITQLQVAYYYDFSKRTRTYVGFNRLDREVKATSVESSQDNFTIGLRHNF